MKFRIVETKDADGRSLFKIEQKVLWWWWSYGIQELYQLGSFICLDSTWFTFSTRESAEEALKQSLEKYSYKDIPIYPTIDPDMFYVMKWSKYGKLGYDYLIHGSYTACCE